ncbi:hypothetical protein ANCDUO_23753 [Ancylostoma duodenale]|uniref:Cysteine rich repeat-containing domain protein n=1 Tax=Ancylostoma duodenale TaxID=51022 RepID=A0A0C2C8W7_9BILA|nr:hypothetical protein ANCDUO_23753 [Ancylostoma duodenale]
MYLDPGDITTSGATPPTTSNGPMLTWMYAIMFSPVHAADLSAAVFTFLYSFMHTAVSHCPYMALNNPRLPDSRFATQLSPTRICATECMPACEATCLAQVTCAPSCMPACAPSCVAANPAPPPPPPPAVPAAVPYAGPTCVAPCMPSCLPTCIQQVQSE